MVEKTIISPSILGGDPSNLTDSVQKIKDAGLKWVHVDIMDGHFVPNLSFGPAVLKALKNKFPDMFYDVHLMLDNPNLYIEPFAKAGADIITIHVEPEYPIASTLDDIHSARKQSGVVINPKTEIGEVIPYLTRVDMVLVMSVQPGFGGQSFMPEVLKKVEILKRLRSELKLSYKIEIDGGVDAVNVSDCIKCGCDVVVAGNSFYKDSQSLIKAVELADSNLNE